MESKKCAKCNQVKTLDQFNKRLNAKGINVGTSYCSMCVYEGSKAWRKDNLDKYKSHMKKHWLKYKDRYVSQAKTNQYNRKDGKYHVYVLPEEHYCGQTDNIYHRMLNHKHLGRYVEDMEIVGSFKTRKEAKFFEAAFHALGCYGKDPKDKTFCLKSLSYE